MKNFLYMFYNSKQFFIVLVFMMIGTSANLFAQRGDKIEKLKMDFIAERLNLSPETARDFWPIYNEYDNAKQMLFRKYRGQMRGENVNLQDVEYRMEREKDFLDLREKYINRFSKILTPVQLTDLNRAEREFKKLVLNKARR